MNLNEYYLLGDIGGTNSNFILYDKEKNKIMKRYNFKTNKIENFIDFLNKLLNKIIDDEKILVEKLIIGIASKIRRNKIKFKLTNSNLEINKKEILEKTSIKKIEIVNDFELIAYSILSKKNKYIINKDEENKRKKSEKNNIKKNKTNMDEETRYKNILIIGAGTGLGVSTIKLNNNLDNEKTKFIIKASEEGHLEFKPKNDFEKNLINFIKKENKKIKNKKKGRENKKIEWEDLVSGRGIENIYNFLNNEERKNKTENKKKDNKKENNLMEKNNKDYRNIKEIIKLKDMKDKIAIKTYDIFFKLYNDFIYEMFLKHKPDEIYIAGGIIQKNLEYSNYFKNKNFGINIYIIKNYNCSIFGLIKMINLF